jgi:hypothetical protein
MANSSKAKTQRKRRRIRNKFLRHKRKLRKQWDVH